KDPRIAKAVSVTAPQTTNSVLRRGLVGKLLVADRASTGERLGFQPRIEFFLRKHLEPAAHLRVAVAAQLRTLNLIRVRACRNEMHWNAEAGRCVLRHAQRNNLERMNHIQ